MSLQPPERRLVTEATLPDYIADIPAVADEVAQAVERRELVQAASVRRIVASDDPNEPLEDGDLLLVYSPPFTAFTDFSGVILADDFTEVYTDGAWRILTGQAGATGGALLQATDAATTRRGLAWDLLTGRPDTADVEVVTRVRVSPSGGIQSAVMVRGSGAAGAETCYVAVVMADTLRIYRIVGGTSQLAASAVPFPQPGTPNFYWIRLRAFGSQIQAKAWNDGSPEPAGWMVTAVDTAITGPGWVGAYASQGQTQSWDLLGVGLDGAAAPTSAVD